MLQGEILELPAPQLLTDASSMRGAMKVKQQNLSLGSLPLGRLAGLFMTG